MKSSCRLPSSASRPLTYALEPLRASFVERIVQLDFKVTRTFRFGRLSVLPVFEVFNVNNSDAIISYLTTNSLAATYLKPEQHHAGPHDRHGRDSSLVRPRG